MSVMPLTLLRDYLGLSLSLGAAADVLLSSSPTWQSVARYKLLTVLINNPFSISVKRDGK